MCAEMACLVRSEGVTVLTLNTDALVERYRQCSCSPVDVPRWASGSGAEKPHPGRDCLSLDYLISRDSKQLA